MEWRGGTAQWRGKKRGGRRTIAGSTDKAAVSNLVAPLYIQLGKAQTGGMEEDGEAVQCGRGGKRVANRQGEGEESGGTCKATMKAGSLNGSPC